MWHSHSSPVSLPFLPNLSEIELLGLSFNEPLEKDLGGELVEGVEVGLEKRSQGFC